MKDAPGVKIAWIQLPENTPDHKLAWLETMMIVCYRPLLNKRQPPLEKKQEFKMEITESMYRKLVIAYFITGHSSSDEIIEASLNQIFEQLGINEFFYAV